MGEKGQFPASAPLDANVINDPPPPYSPYTDTKPAVGESNQLAGNVYPQLGFEGAQANPPAAVNQPQAVQSQTVVVSPPQLAVLGPDSVRLTCPHCRADMSTSLEKDPSIAAYVSAVVIFVLGCVCGCCLIPFCMDSCKSVEHRCSNCKAYLGKYSKY